MNQAELLDVECRLRAVEAELAIRNLAVPFTDAVNERDADAFRRVWTEDAVWEIGAPRGSRAAPADMNIAIPTHPPFRATSLPRPLGRSHGHDRCSGFPCLVRAVAFRGVVCEQRDRQNPAQSGGVAADRIAISAFLHGDQTACRPVEVLAALALVPGVYARVAAFALALFMAFISLMFRRFWSFDGPLNAKAMLRNVFFDNVAVIGGLLLCRRFRCRGACHHRCLIAAPVSRLYLRDWPLAAFAHWIEKKASHDRKRRRRSRLCLQTA